MAERTSSKKAAYGASLVVLSSLFYGSYGIWTKLMGDAFGGYIQGALRAMLVIALLLPIALWHKQLTKIHWRRDARWFVGILCSSVLTTAPLYYATLRIGVGLATALSYAAIVLGLFLFGWVFSGERYTKDKFIATALGLLGIWLIFSPSAHGLGLLGLAAALVSGLAVAFNVVMSQKMPYNASQSTLLAWGIGIIGNLSLGILLHEHTPGLHWSRGWLYLAIFAVVSLMASWSVIRASKLISAGAVGILGLLEVVAGVLFGVAFFGERPSVMVLLGMVLIVAAAAIPYIQHLRVKNEPFTLQDTEEA